MNGFPSLLLKIRVADEGSGTAELSDDMATATTMICPSNADITVAFVGETRYESGCPFAADRERYGCSISSGPSGTKGFPYGLFFLKAVKFSTGIRSALEISRRSSTSQNTAHFPMLSFTYCAVDGGRNFMPDGWAPPILST